MLVIKMKLSSVALTLFDEMRRLFLDDKAGKLFEKILDLRLCEPNDVMIVTVVDGVWKAGYIIVARDLVCRLEGMR